MAVSKSRTKAFVTKVPVGPHICVLMTCHNRRELTLGSLKGLYAAGSQSVRLDVVLVDAGSTDGTADAVKAMFPGISILPERANVYWNAGMRKAWLSALPLKPDFYLWLNDDLALLPGAIDDLLSTYFKHSPQLDGRVIVIGKVVSPTTGQTTYGGCKRSSRVSRLRYRALRDGEYVCDTMTGNCVLIPALAAAEVGISSDRYNHSLGDHDYALRARRHGYRLIQTSSPVGEQESNSSIYSGRQSGRERISWRDVLTHPKGVPWREWLYFCRNFGGPLWPINFVVRYIKIFASSR